MQKQPIILEIPNPCSQNWEQMEQQGDARYCGSCQKQVIDFTGYSDSQVYQYFANSTGKVCGRFTENQLRRKINIPSQPKSKLWKMAVAMGLSLMVAKAGKTQARHRRRPPLTSTEWVVNSGHVSTVPGAANLSGKVADPYTGYGSANALLQVLQGDKLIDSTFTNADGQYCFSMLPAGDYVLHISKPHYTDIYQGFSLSIYNDLTMNFDFKLPAISQDEPKVWVGEVISKPIRLSIHEDFTPGMVKKKKGRKTKHRR